MKTRRLFLLLIPIMLATCNNSKRSDNQQLNVGSVIKLYSEVLDQTRELYISLPENYRESEIKYPVIYILDAEAYFKHSVTLINFLSDCGRIPPMVVVGIPNVNRSLDYSHEPDSTLPGFDCGAERFLKFFQTELIHYINDEYRVNDYQVLKGWCATGFFTLYTMFSEPELFDACIAATPYVVEDHDYIFRMVESFPKHGFQHEKFLYITLGGLDRPDLKEKIPEFAKLLEKKKFDNLVWEYSNLRQNDHYTVEFASLHKGLVELFIEFNNPEDIFNGGIINAVENNLTLGKKYGFENGLPGPMLATISQVLATRELNKESNIAKFLSVEDFDLQNWNRAKEIHKNAIVVDAHAHPMYFGNGVREYFDFYDTTGMSQVSFTQADAGYADAYFMSLPFSREDDEGLSTQGIISQDVEFVKHHLEKSKQQGGLALSSEDIKNLADKDKHAVLLSIEGLNYLDGDVSNLQNYFDDGIRMITIFQFGKDLIADTTGNNPGNHGLSEYGRKVVKEMNRLGMIIDITHCPDSLQLDIIELSEGPVIASHSCARGIIDIDRNIPDHILKNIADKHGLICVTFYSGYNSNRYREELQKANETIKLERERLEVLFNHDTAKIEEYMDAFTERILPENADIEELIDHIDHIVKVAGIDHAGIGSDFGGTRNPRGLEDLSGYPLITYHLLKRGYSEEGINKIMGGNLLRVINEIESTE